MSGCVHGLINCSACAFAAGYEAGAADMRERAARFMLGRACLLTGKEYAEAIRALPLTAPSAGAPK